MQRQQVVRRGNDESPWLTYWQPLFSYHADNNNNNITITKTTPSTGPRRTGDIDKLVHWRTRGSHSGGSRVIVDGQDDGLAGWDGMIFSTTHFTHLRTHTPRTRYETPTRPNIGTSLFSALAGTEHGRP